MALNACIAAFALRQELESRRCRVLFGTYDLASRYVRLPLTPDGRKAPSGIGLFPAPDGDREVRRLAARGRRQRERRRAPAHGKGRAPALS